jgi:heme A synthase
MTYNLTQLQGAEYFVDVFIYSNNSTEGVLGIGFIIALFFVLFMVLKKYEMTHSLIVSSFVCFIVSGLMAYLGVMNIMVVLLFLATTAFTALYIFLYE